MSDTGVRLNIRPKDAPSALILRKLQAFRSFVLGIRHRPKHIFIQKAFWGLFHKALIPLTRAPPSSCKHLLLPSKYLHMRH